MARADRDIVAYLAEASGDLVTVGFRWHDGIAQLDRHHPRFDEIKRDLSRSRQEQRRIWFVWSGPRLTLQDVKIIEADEEER
jgi:hypothetical protein